MSPEVAFVIFFATLIGFAAFFFRPRKHLLGTRGSGRERPPGAGGSSFTIVDFHQWTVFSKITATVRVEDGTYRQFASQYGIQWWGEDAKCYWRSTSREGYDLHHAWEAFKMGVYKYDAEAREAWLNSSEAKALESTR